MEATASLGWRWSALCPNKTTRRACRFKSCRVCYTGLREREKHVCRLGTMTVPYQALPPLHCRQRSIHDRFPRCVHHCGKPVQLHAMQRFVAGVCGRRRAHCCSPFLRSYELCGTDTLFVSVVAPLATRSTVCDGDDCRPPNGLASAHLIQRAREVSDDGDLKGRSKNHT